jgi:hypothetical protein
MTVSKRLDNLQILRDGRETVKKVHGTFLKTAMRSSKTVMRDGEQERWINMINGSKCSQNQVHSTVTIHSLHVSN